MCRPGGLGGESAGIVIDQNLEILEFIGHTGPFLHLPHGEPRFNVWHMAPKILGETIAQVTASARARGGWVERREMEIERSGVRRTVRVRITPDSRSFWGRPTFRVRFENAAARKRPRIAGGTRGSPLGRSDSIAEMPPPAGLNPESREQSGNAMELESAYLELETAHAGLEAVNQELVALNLELAALNVELEDSNRTLVIALEERDRAENRRRQMEEGLLQKQKLESLGVMAGGVAHDFNNILTRIIGNDGLLIEQLPAGTPEFGFADEIERAGLRAGNLVKQMLAYSGSGQFELEPVDLCAIVRDVSELIQASLQGGVRLEYRLEEKVAAVAADASQIQQVVVNLVANASQAISGGGFVSVGVHPASEDELARAQLHFGEPGGDGSYAVLQVSDTGVGMDAATKDRIFEPFFTTKHDGHGLGLAAVLGIVRGHGGSIRVESGIGMGTTFQVFLPVAEPRSPTARPRSRARVVALKGTVLVVDDQASVRAAAGAILRSAGMDVLAAKSGQEAVEAIHASDSAVSVVLLDLTMPGMDGRETLRQIRTLWPRLPVVISSGYDRRGITPGFGDHPNVSFLQKPYKGAELIAKIREAMSGVG